MAQEEGPSTATAKQQQQKFASHLLAVPKACYPWLPLQLPWHRKRVDVKGRRERCSLQGREKEEGVERKEREKEKEVETRTCGAPHVDSICLIRSISHVNKNHPQND